MRKKYISKTCLQIKMIKKHDSFLYLKSYVVTVKGTLLVG
jgi:hypothetical protein